MPKRIGRRLSFSDHGRTPRPYRADGEANLRMKSYAADFRKTNAATRPTKKKPTIWINMYDAV